MITKAKIIAKLPNNPYKYKVMIPIFDKINDIEQHKNLDQFAEATVITIKGIYNSFEIGDVVFVGFEDNNPAQPIILGHLYSKNLVDDLNLSLTTSSLNISNLQVQSSIQLPQNSKISDLNLYEEIKKLNVSVSSLQSEINSLKEKLNLN